MTREFEERQAFPAWSYGVMIAVTALYFLPPFRWPLRLIPISVMALVANLLFEQTSVTNRGVRVQFGYLVPLYVRHIRLEEIEGVEAVTYSPLAEYGGWGIRGFGANVALNASGNRGVRLQLTGGRRLLIGSQRPDELASTIKANRRD